MSFDSDDFALFGLPRRFALDVAELAALRRTLLGQVHPDRFATGGASAQRVALQWAVRVNEACERLKDPLKRAAYLCELHGAPIGAEDNTAMPPAFLMQQMAWREALDDASTRDAVESIARSLDSHRDQAYAELAHALDDGGAYAAAAQQVRALMFVERFANDVEDRLERMEA